MYKIDLSNTRDRLFGKILQQQAQFNGDIAFLVTDDASISFAEAESVANSLAEGLRALGVGRGDRVALMMGNRPEMVLLTLAVNKLGAVWTPINAEYKGDWLLDNLQRCRCTVIVTDEGLQHRIAAVQDRLGDEKLVLLGDVSRSPLRGAHDYESLATSQPLQPDYTSMAYGDTTAILWTSGTTGKSKGVMQSDNAWIRAIVGGASLQYDSQPDDIIYCVLPLYNSAAWITCIYRALIEGIPCVIEQKFSVTTFWERVRHFGATQTFALGAMGVFLINAPERPDDADNPLRTANIVPLPPQHWKAFEQRYGVRLLRSGLGQSECLMVLNQNDAAEDVPVYALGYAPADIEVTLLDDEGVEVENGQVGEICIREVEPHSLFNGYFDDPEATAAAYTGDWYRCGDLGRKDPETGAYFFVDRKKDAIRFAGRNISTMEVESVAGRHPAVRELAAFGIPSEEVESEQELKINIVLKAGQQVSFEDICAFINGNAPFYFVPRYLEFVDSLPMTPTNKVQKFKLREAGITDHTWDLKKSGYKVQR